MIRQDCTGDCTFQVDGATCIVSGKLQPAWGTPLLLHVYVCLLALPSPQAWLWIYTSHQCLPSHWQVPAPALALEQPEGVGTCPCAHVTLLTLFTKLLVRNRDRSLLRGTKLQWVQLPPCKGDAFFVRAGCFRSLWAHLCQKRKHRKQMHLQLFEQKLPVLKESSLQGHSWSICYPVGLFSSLGSDLQLFCGRRNMALGSIIPTICKMVL